MKAVKKLLHQCRDILVSHVTRSLLDNPTVRLLANYVVRVFTRAGDSLRGALRRFLCGLCVFGG